MGLFAGIYARGAAPAETSDEAWVQAMLDVEAALGGPQLKAADIEIGELGREASEHASPVVPLAKRFPKTHAGATSQDILDTAMMLVARRALEPLLDDARATADAAAALAAAHRDTPVMGRTLLQDAVPTSFGLKAAGWLAAIDEACATLTGVPLAVQMGGPVGHRDPAVAARVAERLGLAEPELGWHTNRVRVARLASALGVLAGALGKIARDVTLSEYLREGVRAGVAPRRWSTSRTRSPPYRCSRAQSASRGSWRRCSPRWNKSTSAPRARGSRSGGPSPTCSV